MKEKGQTRLVQNIGIRAANPSALRNRLGLVCSAASPRTTSNPVDPSAGNQGLRASGELSGQRERPSNPQDSPRYGTDEKHRESDKENQGESRKQINGQDRLNSPCKSVVAGNNFDGIFRNRAEDMAFHCLAHIHHHSFVHPRESQSAHWREMTADREPDAKIACAESPRIESPCELNRRRSEFRSDIRPALKTLYELFTNNGPESPSFPLIL